MPLVPLTPPPGVVSLATPLMAGPRWQACNLIRFKEGFIQKLGGCERLTSNTFVGTCRGMHPFADLSSNIYLGVGTEQRLQLYSNGSIYDITPYRHTTTTASFVIADSPLQIFLNDSGAPALLIGDWIFIQTAIGIGNILIQGFYPAGPYVAGDGASIGNAPAGAVASTTFTTAQFSTTSGSRVVTVSFPGSGYSFTNGETLTVWVSTTVGGITIAPGNYTLSGSGSSATFTTAAVATSTASAYENGGLPAVAYLIQTQQEGSTLTGYGVGPYGQGAYGQSSSYTSSGFLRQWSLDNWGENLIGCPTNGSIYQWVPPIGVTAPNGNGLANAAALLTNAPAANTGLFVAMPQQQIVAYGCTDPVSGDQDPMLVRWCDIADNTDWTASATNQAGSFRLPRGSRIVGGIQGPQQGLLWTDLELWAMQYVGYPLVYSFNMIGWGCGLLSQRAVATLGPAVYWAGQNEFYAFNGSAVAEIPCSVWDQFFPLMDRSYTSAVFAWSNSYFDEVWFFMPTGSSDQCSNYVKVNVRGEPIWDYGSMARSAGTDQSVLGAPVASDYNGLLQQHEVAADLDGTAMDSWAQSGMLALGDGYQFMFVERVLPDATVSGGDMLYTLTFTDWANGGNLWTKGPYTIAFGSLGTGTQYQVVRGRGRYVQVKVESSALGVAWRLGKIEGLSQAAGSR